MRLSCNMKRKKETRGKRCSQVWKREDEWVVLLQSLESKPSEHLRSKAISFD